MKEAGIRKKNELTRSAYLIIGLLVLAGLYLASFYSYLLFHSIAELFSIAISMAIFVFAWHTRRLLDNDYLLFLGISYLFVSLLDLLHTLGYPGMGVFQGFETNLPTQLWIAARYTESVSLLVAPLFFTHKLKIRRSLVVHLSVFVLILLSIFYWHNFPVCFIEGQGLTPFKKISEYLISTILFAGMILLYKNRQQFDSYVFKCILLSIALTICSELAFTFYIHAYGLSNLVGHYFKILSFYLLYRAIIETGLTKPYNVLFRNLSQKEQTLEKIRDELELRVQERTKELVLSTKKLQQEMAEKSLAKKALKTSITHLHTLINTIPDLVWLKDTQGVYLFCNPRVEHLYGAKAEDIIGKNDHDLVGQELADSFRKYDKVVIATGEPCVNEEEVVFANDGHHELLETIKTPMFSENGDIVGILGIARDITERKESETEKINLEKRLQQAQKMEAIGTLAGGIAHDFNNILGIILGYADMAKEDAPPGTQLAKDLEEILIAANRAKDLVKQILAFSRQAEVERIPLKIQPLIKEGLKMLRSSIPTTISITENIDPKSGIILADPTQIHQILMNLCTNAYHAMEETGGVLSVTVRTAVISSDDKAMLLHIKPGKYVEIMVADTGRGIGPDVIEKIFDPYFTTKGIGKGTGLGLAIIHGLMSDYGGTITVESELGKGATFHVYFPVVERDVLPERKEPNDIPKGKERILLVDDEELLAQMSKEMLERLGYHVTVRYGSLEALEIFQNTPNEFDLVITDQTMPDMIGSDLSRHMMQIRPDIPIILCTGYSNLIDEHSAKALGIKEFILKPLNKEVIARLIRKVLNGAV